MIYYFEYIFVYKDTMIVEISPLINTYLQIVVEVVTNVYFHRCIIHRVAVRTKWNILIKAGTGHCYPQIVFFSTYMTIKAPFTNLA